MGPGQEEGGPAADGRGRRGAPGNNAVPADLRPSSLASIEGYLFVERSHPANSQRYREPKKLSSCTSPDRQGLARARAALDVPVRLARGRRRRRGTPWREFRPLPVFWRAPGSASRARTPRDCVHYPAQLQETSPRCMRPSEPTAAGRERGLRWKSWQLRCLGPEPGGCPLPSQLLCFNFAPCVLEAHFGGPREPLIFQLLAPCLGSLNANCTEPRCPFRA